MIVVLFLLSLVGFGTEAASALTRAELNTAGFHLQAGAPLPRGLLMNDSEAHATSLAAALGGKPALLVFVDYTCQSLCGVIFEQLARATQSMSKRPGRDFSVLAVALDAASTPRDAALFRDTHTEATPLQRGGHFLTGSPDALRTLRDAVGLVAPYDPDHKQFAHPAGIVVVNAQGEAERVIGALGIDAFDLTLALDEAAPVATSLNSHALLLCYGWDAATGLYTLRIERILTGACLASLFAIALAVIWLLRAERRVKTSRGRLGHAGP